MKRVQYCALLLQWLLAQPLIALAFLICGALPIRGLRSTRLGVMQRGLRDLEGG